MSSPKKGLGSKGRGIEALINEQVADFNEKSVSEININKIEPNREQPRRLFNEEALEELAESIKQYGIIQPVILKKVDDYYELIAGERRWRAAKIAGITKIPAIVREYDDAMGFEIALVENIQRENLNPIEEAESYKKLVDIFGYTQEKLAEKVGKSRSAVTNALRLLNLDPRVRNFVLESKLTNGHARALLSINDGNLQFELAERILEENLSVREVESLVKKILENKEKKESEKKPLTSFDTSEYKTIENDLKNILGTRVRLNCKKNKGKIEIEYYSNDDLDRLLEMIRKIES